MFKLMRNRNRKGFSLMELILVVAIMSILAGILTPMVFASRDAAKIAKVNAELDAIGTAARMFYADNGAFPANLAALAAGGYVSESDPTDPWGNDYGLLAITVTYDTDGRPQTGSYIAAFSETEKDGYGAAEESPSTKLAVEDLFHLVVIDL